MEQMHILNGYRRGAKIIWKCDTCDFIRIHNTETGNITTTHDPNNPHDHSGQYLKGEDHVRFEPNPNE